MSRAVYEKSVNFVSANLSRVKDNQESFISREPPGIPHRGPLDQRRLKISKDFPRQGCHYEPGAGDFPKLPWEWAPATFIGNNTKENQKNFLTVHYPSY